jgi:hypothetical protein
MRFELFKVTRQYGANGWEVHREPLNEHFEGLSGLQKAAAYAANLALLGDVIEIWGVQPTFNGQDKRLVAALSWWAFKRGAASIAYDTDYLD